MTIDIRALWDFAHPEISQQRFTAALETASPDEALILRTQIARTYGLRRDFDRARQLLAEIQPQMPSASPEAQVRYQLELGRTYASATHPPEAQTPESREQARACYMRAFELAQTARLDDLAIDALHMMTVVDTAPEQQLEWNRKAVEYMRASTQAGAKAWAGSLLNNTGYALHLMGRYVEALEYFQMALQAREAEGEASRIRIAWWMIAWTQRALGRLDEALQIQLRLERECDQVSEPDADVFEELELLYKTRGDTEKAEYYAQRRNAAS